MTEMELSPPLAASGLEERYKRLADFGGHVLAAQETTLGMKFATWSWDYDRAGVTMGHYFHDDYEAAKEDFALRSGLVHKEKLFTPAQLAAMYRCTEHMLASDGALTYEQEQMLQSVREQIGEFVPNLQEPLAQTNLSQQTM